MIRLLYLLHTDPDFLDGFCRDADAALAGMSLAAREASAVKAGDVAALYLAGAHPFLLHGLVRHQLCGVTQDTYMTEVRRAAAEKRSAASLR